MNNLKSFTLDTEQVEAIFHLLYQINLVTLERTGKINQFEKITPEDARVLQYIFYDEEFAKPLSGE